MIDDKDTNHFLDFFPLQLSVKVRHSILKVSGNMGQRWLFFNIAAHHRISGLGGKLGESFFEPHTDLWRLLCGHFCTQQYKSIHPSYKSFEKDQRYVSSPCSELTGVTFLS